MSTRRYCGVPLRAFCPRITRGIQLSKREIITCLTAKPTPYRYLTLADLDKSLHVELDVESLPYFDPTPLGKNIEQFCARKNMILLTKNDTPYKVDLVGDIGEENIIVSGNIYMMTVNEQMVHPASLCLWLKSDEGMRMLRNTSSSTRGNMKWISIKQLNEMLLPEFTEELQRELISDKIEEIQHSMQSIENQLRSLLNTMYILTNSVTPDRGAQGYTNFLG